MRQPYEFGIRFSVDGDYFALGGLSMGDMVRINREFARVIREAKHARGLISGFPVVLARCSSP